MSPLVVKFAFFNIAVNVSAVKSLNSAAAIYLLRSGILFSTTVRTVLVAKLLILGILFLISFILALRAALVAKLVIVCISFLTLFILALRAVLVTKLVISSILYSTSFILA